MKRRSILSMTTGTALGVALPAMALAQSVTPAGDPLISKDLAAPHGAGLVGFSHAGAYDFGTVGRKLLKSVNVNDAPYNAVGDGVTDDTAAVQGALNALGSFGGLVMIPNGMKCVVDSNLNIPQNCSLVGADSSLGHINPLNIANFAPAIYLNSAATITLNNGSQLRSLVILRKGLIWNITSDQVAAQFQGTAITIANATTDAVVDECTVLGFNVGIRSAAGARNVSRVRLRRLNMDNIHCIILDNSYDITYIQEVHCWPFVTVASIPEGENAHLKRSGSAIRLSIVGDWTKLSECFTYGYRRGYQLSGVDSVVMVSCGSDYPGIKVDDGSIGTLIDGPSFECVLIGCQSAASANGVYINTSDTNGSVTMVGHTTWETLSNAIVLQRGTLILSDSKLRKTKAASTGLAIVSTATRAKVSNTSINGFNLGIANGASTVPLLLNNVDFSGTTTFVTAPYNKVIASAATLALDGESLTFTVSGAINILAINGAAAYAGKMVTLIFQGALTLAHGNNLRIAGNFATKADDTIMLACNGTNFYEVSRSVN